jgi:hypothetical protein
MLGMIPDGVKAEVLVLQSATDIFTASVTIGRKDYSVRVIAE